MNKGSEEEYDPFGPFNLNDFKKWMGGQHDNKSKSHMIGLEVESKVSYKKLLSRIIEMDEGDSIEEVAKDFKENGGVISEMDGPNILIEVDSGSFIIHRMYVKRLED